MQHLHSGIIQWWRVRRHQHIGEEYNHKATAHALWHDVGRTQQTVWGHFMFHTNHTKWAITRAISMSWVILDNQFTVDIFCSRELLTDIHIFKDKVHIHSNAGTSIVTRMGTFYNLAIFYSPNGIANIFSLVMFPKSIKCLFDSAQDNIFYLQGKDGVILFNQSTDGIYFVNTENEHMAMANYVVKMVTANSKGYTKCQIKQMAHAVFVQHMVSNPHQPGF